MDTKEMKTWLDGVEEKLSGGKTEIAEIKARLDVMEQKGARRGGAEGPGPSLGERFVEGKASDLALLTGRRGHVSMEVKATLTSAVTDAAGSVGDLGSPQRDGVTLMPRRRMTIRNLLTVINTVSGSVEYAKLTGRTNNAAMVAEAALKPQSDIKFDLETAPMRTIAHYMKASRQVLEDLPQLKGIIDGELIYGLNLKEEAQLLSGDGTGQNLYGMIPQATAFAAPAGLAIEDMNVIDAIGLAILQATLTDVEPDGIVLHPSDWWAARLQKDSDGKYILGDPQSNVAPSLFGLPVVPTQAQATRKFLVGAFREQTLYDRWAARVEVATENEDDFIRNLVTILAEERIGFAAKRPEALIYGDFDTALAA